MLLPWSYFFKAKGISSMLSSQLQQLLKDADADCTVNVAGKEHFVVEVDNVNKIVSLIPIS